MYVCVRVRARQCLCVSVMGAGGGTTTIASFDPSNEGLHIQMEASGLD